MDRTTLLMGIAIGVSSAIAALGFGLLILDHHLWSLIL